MRESLEATDALEGVGDDVGGEGGVSRVTAAAAEVVRIGDGDVGSTGLTSALHGLNVGRGWIGVFVVVDLFLFFLLLVNVIFLILCLIPGLRLLLVGEDELLLERDGIVRGLFLFYVFFLSPDARN